jgi:hypothetical protein
MAGHIELDLTDAREDLTERRSGADRRSGRDRREGERRTVDRRQAPTGKALEYFTPWQLEQTGPEPGA